MPTLLWVSNLRGVGHSGVVDASPGLGRARSWGGHWEEEAVGECSARGSQGIEMTACGSHGLEAR